MRQPVLDGLDGGNVDAAIETILEDGNPPAVLNAFHQAINYAYWQKKDIAGVVALGAAAIEFADVNASPATRAALKPVSYDIASFCWPGWDEPGVAIDGDARAFGAKAARLNLTLAEELDRPDAAKAAARWIVGAHHLASGDNERAATCFESAAALAKGTGDRATELLYRGYVAIALRRRFDTDELATLEDGPGLVAQLETAVRVFA